MPAEDIVQALTGYTERVAATQTLRDYYTGRHQLRFATHDFEAKYGDIVRSLRENLIPGVVAAYADKTHVEAWSADDEALDTAVLEGLDRLHARVTREKYLTGSAFVLVWPGPDGSPQPHFHRSHELIPTVDPMRQGRLLHVVKPIFDRQERLPRANIYYPDRVERFVYETPRLGKGERPDWGRYMRPEAWVPYTIDGEPDVIRHSMGDVPVLWFKHDDDGPESWGRSVIAEAIPLQDALNTSIAQMVVLGEAYARPFWYLLNYKAAQDGSFLSDPAFARALAAAQTQAAETASVEQARFDPTQGSIFATDAAGPFGQLDPPDMTRLLQVQDGIALKIARVTGIPPFYLSQSPSDIPSGEALRKLQVRIDTSVRTANKESAPVWRGLKLLLGMDDAPPVFADPNPSTRAERIDEAKAMRDLGYSLEDCLRHVEQTKDVSELLSRAEEAQARSTEALGRSLAAGRIPASY